jgi:hypothetical protein
MTLQNIYELTKDEYWIESINKLKETYEKRITKNRGEEVIQTEEVKKLQPEVQRLFV